MNRLGPVSRLVVAIVVGALLSGGALTTTARAATPDRSDVVLVLDFSASILNDKANRNRFATALERIAARVDETSADLVAGDTTASLVQFAGKAIDTPGCVDLHLLNSPETVGKFADCLRTVGAAYRKGLDPKLVKKIGIDTNYVAAMQQAAKHLPADATRPALILFTDGKHDVRGTPVSQVQVVRDKLFGSRTPFVLLPVGMGLDPKERGALAAGLEKMQITRDMPACVSGATFDWPQVVFDSADQAGNAVAVALQDATCTFTVAPTPGAPAAPTPATPALRSIGATAGDGRIQLIWTPLVGGTVAVTDYKARCRTGEGDWIESTEGVSTEPAAVVEGLTNGAPYTCEVAAVSSTGDGPWTPVTGTVIPIGQPGPPGKPSVEALNGAVKVSVAADRLAGASGLHFECSPDNGATWPKVLDLASVENPTAQLIGLTNGTEYVCRAFAVNDVGRSEASPMSDAFKPCASTLDCNPILAPVLGVLGLALAIGLIMVLVALFRSRRRGYVLAVVDVVHTANLGYGSRLGLGFIRDPATKRITDVVADRGKTAEIRIRHRGGGRFEVRDRHGPHTATDGEAIVVMDSVGARHEVVLRAFNTNAASPVATRH